MRKAIRSEIMNYKQDGNHQRHQARPVPVWCLCVGTEIHVLNFADVTYRAPTYNSTATEQPPFMPSVYKWVEYTFTMPQNYFITSEEFNRNLRSVSNANALPGCGNFTGATQRAILRNYTTLF